MRENPETFSLGTSSSGTRRSETLWRMSGQDWIKFSGIHDPVCQVPSKPSSMIRSARSRDPVCQVSGWFTYPCSAVILPGPRRREKKLRGVGGNHQPNSSSLSPFPLPFSKEESTTNSLFSTSIICFFSGGGGEVEEEEEETHKGRRKRKKFFSVSLSLSADSPFLSL